MPKGLTPQRKKFTKAFKRTGNVMLAYKEAGYVCPADDQKGKWITSNAYRLLDKPVVQQELARLKQLDDDRDQIGDKFAIDYVRNKFISLGEKAESKGDIATAKACWVELARTCNHYSLDNETTIKHQLTLDKLEYEEAKAFTKIRCQQLTNDVIDLEVEE